MCREFGLANSAILTISKNGTKIISAFEQNGWRVMRIGKPERNDVSVALLKWVKRERIDSVPASGLLLIITFVLPKF